MLFPSWKVRMCFFFLTGGSSQAGRPSSHGRFTPPPTLSSGAAGVRGNTACTPGHASPASPPSVTCPVRPIRLQCPCLSCKFSILQPNDMACCSLNTSCIASSTQDLTPFFLPCMPSPSFPKFHCRSKTNCLSQETTLSSVKGKLFFLRASWDFLSQLVPTSETVNSQRPRNPNASSLNLC